MHFCAETNNAFILTHPLIQRCHPNPLRTSKCTIHALSALEPSYPLPVTSQNLPDAYRRSTIYYNIPAIPPHLAEGEPLLHSKDGDCYILAISFPSDDKGQIWVRGRFARTRPFLRESRARKRIYPGSYATPGISGWNAPMKPRSSCVDGIYPWGPTHKNRLVVFGPYALPLLIAGDTLVSKGPTALGNILTDSNGLLSERGTELCCTPVRWGDSVIVLSIARSPTATVMGAFVTEIASELKRFPRIIVPKGGVYNSLAVSQRFIVTAMSITKKMKSNLFSSLFGKRVTTPPTIVKAKPGSTLTLFSRSGAVTGSVQLEGIIVDNLLSVHEHGNELSVVGLFISPTSDKTELTNITMADAASGALWNADEAASVRRDVFVLDLAVDESSSKKVLKKKFTSVSLGEDIRPVAAARQFDAKSFTSMNHVLIVYDTANSRSGIVMIDTRNSSIEQKWMTSSSKCVLTCALLSESGTHVAVLQTNKTEGPITAHLLIFDVGSLSDGPVTTVKLEKEHFGELGIATGGAWANHELEWDEDGAKPIKSAYEIFESRNWNDIDSSFSSLGFNQ